MADVTIGGATGALTVTTTAVGADLVPMWVAGSGVTRAITRANFLSGYAANTDGTWTPSLAFGGSTTGITYASRWGIYTRVGNLLSVSALLSLSSKGAQTGAAKIFGLPVLVRTGYAATLAPVWFSMAASLVAMSGIISGVDGGIDLYGATAAAASLSALTNASFGNASILYLSAMYLV